MAFSYSGPDVIFRFFHPIAFVRSGGGHGVFDAFGRTTQRKPPLHVEHPIFFPAYFRHYNSRTIPVGTRTVVVVPDPNGPEFAQALRGENHKPVVVGALQDRMVRTVQPMNLEKDNTIKTYFGLKFKKIESRR